MADADLEILAQLNADYLASDQNGDVRRYEQILADDFMASSQRRNDEWLCVAANVIAEGI